MISKMVLAALISFVSAGASAHGFEDLSTRKLTLYRVNVNLNVPFFGPTRLKCTKFNLSENAPQDLATGSQWPFHLSHSFCAPSNEPSLFTLILDDVDLKTSGMKLSLKSFGAEAAATTPDFDSGSISAHCSSHRQAGSGLWLDCYIDPGQPVTGQYTFFAVFR